MTRFSRNSGKHNLSTEDLLNDYLNDVFGSDSVCSTIGRPQELSSSHELDEEFIELDESNSYSNYSRQFQKAEAAEVCKKYDIDKHIDESIVVTELEYDLLPQERKGAIEKFCVNRVALYQTSESNVLFSKSQLQLVGDNGVKNGSFLIPIWDFTKVASKSGFRSPEEAYLLLLNSLYFLRRPLSPRVRRNFLNFGEQALDDFHASKWLFKFNSEALEEE